MEILCEITEISWNQFVYDFRPKRKKQKSKNVFFCQLHLEARKRLWQLFKVQISWTQFALCSRNLASFIFPIANCDHLVEIEKWLKGNKLFNFQKQPFSWGRQFHWKIWTLLEFKIGPESWICEKKGLVDTFSTHEFP